MATEGANADIPIWNRTSSLPSGNRDIGMEVTPDIGKEVVEMRSWRGPDVAEDEKKQGPIDGGAKFGVDGHETGRARGGNNNAFSKKELPPKNILTSTRSPIASVPPP